MPVVNVAAGVLGGVPEPTIFAGPYAVTLTWLPPRLYLHPHAHEQATLNVVLEGEYRETIEGGGRLRAELARRDDVTPLAVEGLVGELFAELARIPIPRPDARNRWPTRAPDLLHDDHCTWGELGDGTTTNCSRPTPIVGG